jgi:hypothetical protein
VAGKTRALTTGAKLAVKYGPLVKVAWDQGGKQAASAATKRAMTLNSRRKALAHASGLVDGSILKIAPEGTTMYVVFTGDHPVATYPPQSAPLTILLQHADLSKRIRPEDVRRRRPRVRPRQLR